MIDRMAMTTTLSTGPDRLVDVVRRLPMLEALRRGPLRREELERRLDVSRTTCYRYTNWLADGGLVEGSSEGFALTRLGEVITEEVVRFEAAVTTALGLAESDPELLLDVVRYAPGLEVLVTEPCDRRELERQIAVSRTTSYRFTRSFEEVGVVEKSHGKYALTAAGEEIASAVATFETGVRTALRLEPVLEAVSGTTPAFDLGAFADATVTTTGHGDAHSPVNRCIRLLQETDSLRAVDMNSIAPLYLGDLVQLVVEGMVTENVQTPEAIANILAEHPDKCIEACERGNVTVYLHDGLPYSLVVLDDRVGIGVRDRDARTLQTFVDTDSPDAREWAEAVFESYKRDAVEMTGFSPWAFRRAMERMSPDTTEATDR
jgi:predicted transcriptional regulator